ncbi:hypothetical protein CBM2586_A50127 [Cupriavidus phytorum]|uniref:Uncharacterized protein n=1 Tax=Cupriavidus taiwanensis TaxID=164546 RepID=A0A975X9T0_9BURK|nr:hypothetical protein CBM2586_A50127 [Cupriavidus taiwanensis]
MRGEPERPPCAAGSVRTAPAASPWRDARHPRRPTLAKDRLAGRAGARKPAPFLYNASF